MKSDISIGKFDISKHNRTQNVLKFVLFIVTWKINLVNIFVPSLFTIFDVDYHDKSALITF